MTEENPRYWLQMECHGCDAKVGELHESGCDMERCPFCDPTEERQLATCGHYDKVMNRDLPRIPYIQRLVRCETCNDLSPEFFEVPDEEWDKYVIPILQHKVLCIDCYVVMKELFPNGWRAKERGDPASIPYEEAEILYKDSYMTVWEDETPRDGIKVDHEGTEYSLIEFSSIEDDEGNLVLSYKIKKEKNQFLYYIHPNKLIFCDMEEFFIRNEELEKSFENGATKLEL